MVSEQLKGRILDALGNPIDGKPPIEPTAYYPVENEPPNPLERRRITEPITLGVRAIDSLLTMGRGQRVGIFAGSGVGKSTTLGMIARESSADINVIVLVGERGREVRDFMENDLREEGLAKSVIVVATSDMPAMLRLKSAMIGTSIAEFFRDKGYNVLLMMDSITRFAMAQREIGMAVGEPPVARGFTPSVYAILPKLLERSGTSRDGTITGIYTVLVEGDDMNEPISDTVRGILDGHFVLSRKLANSNHYPPIDILSSISRLMPEVATPEHYAMAQEVKNMMAAIAEAESLLLVGAYKPGTNPTLDKALDKKDLINAMLKQGKSERSTNEERIETLREITEFE
jgi:flagellum-specific ATP synthase